MTIKIKRAAVKDANQLHIMMLANLEDKTSETYKVNIERFGIPEEYVRQAFSLEALTKAIKDKKQLFLVAVVNRKLIGFAQTIRKDKKAAELDRIFVVPEKTGKGIGTKLLNETVDTLRKENFSKLIVKAGKDETLARKFYEKNGFKLVEETIIQAPWGTKLSLAIYELEIKN